MLSSALVFSSPSFGQLRRVAAAPLDKPQRVELKPTIVRSGKAIPDHALREAEADKLDWPDAAFTLFYKKGFASFGIQGEEEHVVRKAWYKPLPALEWMEVPDQLLKTLDFNFAYMGGEDDAAKGIVAGYALMDVPPGMWKLDVDMTVDFIPSTKNMEEDFRVLEGHSRFTIEASAPQVDHVGNPVELHPQWISGMEWAPTMKGPWQKVPKPGEKGFPLHVKQPLDIYLRAIKQYPNEPWPTEGFTNMDIGERLPKWEGRYMGTRIEQSGQPQLADDVFWVNRNAVFWENSERIQKGEGIVASTSDNLLKITANAGANETAQLFIDPQGP